MTLDEAIEVYKFWANAHERDAEYHRPLGYSHESIANVAEMRAREERQIAEWLKELKAYRETYPYGVDRFNGSDTPQTKSCFYCNNYEPKGWCNLFEDTVSPNYKCCSEFAEIMPYEYGIKALYKEHKEPYCEIEDCDYHKYCKERGQTDCSFKADTPQTERIKTPDYCDICNHKGCENCIANNLDDYCVPSGYEPITQTETQNSNLTFEKDECAKEYEELGLKELKELIKADRKTENSSEKPNNCEPQTEAWQEPFETDCSWK